MTRADRWLHRYRWAWLGCYLFMVISLGVENGWAVGLSGLLVYGHLAAVGFAPTRYPAWVRGHRVVVVVGAAATGYFFLALPPGPSQAWCAVGAAGAAVLAVVLLLPDRETRDAAREARST